MQAREERTSAAAFGRVLVNSYFSRESVLRAVGVDARVCYLGIDTEKFAAATGDRSPFVLSVGEFAKHKNPEFIVRALGASRSKPPLVWVANRVQSELVKDATRLAERLGVDLRIEEAVSEDQLVDFYRRASALLYAPRLEPFGFAPLEAGSCGTPVIAVAEGGVRETVEHLHTSAFWWKVIPSRWRTRLMTSWVIRPGVRSLVNGRREPCARSGQVMQRSTVWRRTLCRRRPLGDKVDRR